MSITPPQIIEQDQLTIVKSRNHFNDQQLAQIDTLRQQLSPANLNSFGADVLTKANRPADNILSDARGIDFGGDINLSDILSEMRDIDSSTKQPSGFFAKFIKKAKANLLEMRDQYNTLAVQTNNMGGILTTQRDQLVRHHEMVAQLTESLRETTVELEVYVAAAELELNHVLQDTIPALQANAADDSLAQQDLADAIDYATFLSDRIHNLKQAGATIITQRNSLRMTNALIKQKINDLEDTIATALPLIKTSIASTLITLSLEKAVALDQVARDTTGNLMVTSTQKLQEITQRIDKQRAKGIVDVNAITQSRQLMIDIMQEHINRQADIDRQRKDAEVTFEQIQSDNQKLLGIQSDALHQHTKNECYD